MATPRVCAHEGCGVSIEGRHHNARFCSVECRREHGRPRARQQSYDYFIQNKDARRERTNQLHREFHARNRDRRLAKTAAWKAANPDKVRDAVAARRASRAAVHIEDVDRSIVWDRDSGICHVCNQAADPADWHLDHIMPIAKGGEHSYANTAVSHPRCNLSKGARLLS